MAIDLVSVSIGVTVPFVVLCIVSFIVRIYARKRIAKSFGADDWTMVVAFIFWIGQQYLTYSWVYLGAGKHQSTVSVRNIQLVHRYLFAEEFLYLALQLLIKQSILLFYLRFLGTTKWRRAIYAAMGLVCVQVAGTWIFYGLQCIPIQAYFYPERYPEAKCLTTGVAYYAPSAVNVMVDFIIYVLPIKPLCSLEASLGRRLRLLAVMTLGGCTILVSLLRFIVLYQLATRPDFTYILGRVVIVTTIEFVSGMVTANMPAISTAYKVHISGEIAWDSEMGKLSTTPSGGHAINRQLSSRLTFRKTGPGAIPITRNKASVSIGSTRCHEMRDLSPTHSTCQLVKSPGVVVVSKWEITNEEREMQRKMSRSPGPMKLRDDV